MNQNLSRHTNSKAGFCKAQSNYDCTEYLASKVISFSRDLAMQQIIIKPLALKLGKILSLPPYQITPPSG
jgi:hypothetical protein